MNALTHAPFSQLNGPQKGLGSQTAEHHSQRLNPVTDFTGLSRLLTKNDARWPLFVYVLPRLRRSVQLNQPDKRLVGLSSWGVVRQALDRKPKGRNCIDQGRWS
jgi:hypothetical protein